MRPGTANALCPPLCEHAQTGAEMSKFDRHRKSGTGNQLPSGGGTRPRPAVQGSQVGKYISHRPTRRSSRLESAMRQRQPRFAIALDATASMVKLIGAAKESIRKILTRVWEEAEVRVEIQLFAYRDYDMEDKVIETSALTHEPEVLLAWLRTLEVDGGAGNGGEAVEVALETISNADEFNAVILAGDEPPHHRGYLDSIGLSDTPTAFDRAHQFGEQSRPIHTFVVGSDPRTRRDFAQVSESSGGKSGRLDGSSEMIDMAVMAILASIKGTEFVQKYMNTHVLTNQAKDFGTKLLSGPKKITALRI